MTENLDPVEATMVTIVLARVVRKPFCDPG